MTTPDVRKEFGAAVRARRLRLGISQETLAERAELHRTYVTDVERGARNLSLESISRLARALEISIDALFSPLSNPGSSKTPSGTRTSEAKPIAILLVEDDPKDAELTVAAFAKAKFSNRIKIICDGAAALDYLLKSGTSSQIQREADTQVVLLDLYLPKVDGLEVLRTIRQDASIKNLDVIVLTNSRSNAHLREAMRLGANAYIVKPVGFENFSAITPQLNFYWSLLTRAP